MYASLCVTVRSVTPEDADGDGEHSQDGLGPLSVMPSPDQPVLRDGMTLPAREDGGPPLVPDTFTVTRLESGFYLVRKRRLRNMQKIGVGGFYVKARGPKILNMKDEEERLEAVNAAAAAYELPEESADQVAATSSGDKPRRKPIRRQRKYKLIETYPAYLQVRFFSTFRCHFLLSLEIVYCLAHRTSIANVMCVLFDIGVVFR